MAKIPRLKTRSGTSASKKTSTSPTRKSSSPGKTRAKSPAKTKKAAGDRTDISREAKEPPRKSKSGILDWVHTGLDVAGMVPGVGNVADLANAGLYAVRGDLVNAGISLAGAVPGGQVATGARLAYKGGKEVTEAAVESGAKKLAKSGPKPNPKAADGGVSSKRAKRSQKIQEKELVGEHQNFETARNKAHSEIGPLGQDYRRTTGRLGEAKGKTQGIQSTDGKRGVRLDYDPEKGTHMNWYDWSGGAKGKGGRWGAEKFPGGEAEFKKLLKQYDNLPKP